MHNYTYNYSQLQPRQQPKTNASLLFTRLHVPLPRAARTQQSTCWHSSTWRRCARLLPLATQPCASCHTRPPSCRRHRALVSTPFTDVHSAQNFFTNSCAFKCHQGANLAIHHSVCFASRSMTRVEFDEAKALWKSLPRRHTMRRATMPHTMLIKIQEVTSSNML